MSIRINKKISFQYIILFLAIFNDILRVPGTGISIFRSLTPFILLKSLPNKKAKKILGGVGFIIAVNFVQNIVFSYINFYGINFSLLDFALYSYYYFSISLILIVIIRIYYASQQFFAERFISFLKRIGWMLLLLLSVHDVILWMGIANENNYGMYIAAVFPIYVLEYIEFKRIKDFAFCVLSFIALTTYDCKMALLGIFVEIFVIYIITVGKRVRIGLFLWKLIGVISLVSIILVSKIQNTNLGINGQSLTQLVKDPINIIVEGNALDSSEDSASYRINVFIVGIRQLIETKFLGIGMGNSGKLMVLALGAVPSRFFGQSSIALHNTVIEIMLEFGIVAVIFIIAIIKRIIESFKKRKVFSNSLFIIEFISLPIWILGPSKIQTCYYMWIVIFFSIIIQIKNEKQNMNKAIFKNKNILLAVR